MPSTIPRRVIRTFDGYMAWFRISRIECVTLPRSSPAGVT